LAVISGGIAAVVAILEATTKFGATGEGIRVTDALAASFAARLALAAILGFLAWETSSQETMLQLEIEEAAETIDDKATFIDTIEEAASTSDLNLERGWTRATLTDAVRRWCDKQHGHEGGSRPVRAGAVGWLWRGPEAMPLRTMAAMISHVDFTRLLTATGLEQA
jgi:hypothetical protein